MGDMATIEVLGTTTPSWKSSLSPELLEKARVELNEDQSKVPDQIKSLRERILEDPKRRNFRTDDAFLIRFLRVCKYEEDAALELMINYYRQRQKIPDYCRKSCTELEHVLKSNYHMALTTRDKNGCAVVVGNSISHWNPDEVSVSDVNAHVTLILERLVEDEDVQVCGLVGLADLKGLSLKHFLAIGPLAMKKGLDALVYGFPIRHKAIHYINEPALFGVLFAMARPFLSQKLIDRIHLHGNRLEELHEYFDVDTLPEEFGGKAGPFDCSQWNAVLKDHEATVVKNFEFGFVS